MIAYRPDVDGLRAVAIVTVVACHIGLPGWSGGYVGVDIFFVISGFLITSLLVAEAEAYRHIDLWGFYARRVRRLLPAFLTVLSGTLLLGLFCLVSLDGEQQALAKSAIAALLLNANHYYWLATGGYFDRPAELLPLLHLWSLAVEEQFYLIWPLGLMALLGVRPSQTYHQRVMTALWVVLLASLGLSIWLTWTRPSAAFYLMPSRAWELAVGSILALVPVRTQSAHAVLGGIALSFSGIVAITTAVASYGQNTAFPGFAALLPVLGAAALIAGNALAPQGFPARFLSSAPMVMIGRVSYSWYLWHWPLLAITRSVQLGTKDLLRDFLLAGILAFVLACATYRWIENPIRRSSMLRSYPARVTVRFGVLVTVVCVLLAASLGARARLGPKSALELKLMVAAADRPPLQEACHGAGESRPLLPSVDRCVLPPGSRVVDTILWGDSHADHWMPALAEIARNNRMSVYQLTRDGCPPYLPTTRAGDDLSAHRCATAQRLAVKEIEEHRSNRGLKTVVLSSDWVAQDAQIRSRLPGTLDHLGTLGLKVLIIGPTPGLRYTAPECLLRHNERFCAWPRADYNRKRARTMHELAQATSDRPYVKFLDPTPFFCDEELCRAIRNGQVLYRDAGHVSASASRSFAAFASADFSWLR